MISITAPRRMLASLFFIPLICLGFSPALAAMSVPETAMAKAAPHRAIYDVVMTASRSSAQVINIRGKMFYEWGMACDAFVTNHRFNLVYEYADSPGMRVSSDFATYEANDGRSFNFSSRRARDGQLYQDLRGSSNVERAVYTSPEDLSFDLPQGTMFPSTHTLHMIDAMKVGTKFFSATVFDGSDEDGPIEINTFFGGEANPMKTLKPSDKLDMSLLNTPARHVRMAVFPLNSDEEESDYEMSLVFHDNGVISDMVIDYDDFSVRQTLVALEKMEPKCGMSAPARKMPDDKAKP